MSPQNPQRLKVFVGTPNHENSVEWMETEEPQQHPHLPDSVLTYRAVDLEELEGKNFLNKMEILMAVLTGP